MRLLLVAALLVSLLSGCTALGSGPDVMTAKQALGPADRAAQRWADDAILLDASASELDDEARREARDEFQDQMEELKEARDDGEISDDLYRNITEFFQAIDVVLDIHDGDIGDGRASMWGFSYVSQSAQDVYMVAVARGEVVYKGEMSRLEEDDEDFDFGEFLEEPALGDWSVDSDEASAAASLDEDYKRICGGTNVMAFLSLTTGEAGPVWYVGAASQGGDEQEDDFVFLAVDATTGSLIVDETVVPDPVQDILYQESGVVDGQFLGAVQTSMGGTFDVQDDGHLGMSLHARVQPPPLQPVTITVTDPEGRETTLTLQRGVAPFVALADAFVDAAPRGSYDVQVETSVSLRDDWSLYWCTDGLPMDESDLQNPACEVFYEGGAASGGADGPRAETLSRFARWLGAWQP